jgi:predicted ATPase
MLTNLEVTNYKSIAHANLNFNQETVIVGPNASGKSNLLDAIHFIRDISNDNLDHAITKRHGVNSIRRWSKTRPYNITVAADFYESKENFGKYRISIASKDGNFNVIEEEGSWTSQSPFQRNGEISTFSFRRDLEGNVRFDVPDNPFERAMPTTIAPSESLITLFGSRGLSPLSLFFSTLHHQISSIGAYAIYPNKIREPQSISNLDILNDDGANLASIIRQMRSSSYRSNREALTSSLRQVLPILNEIRIDTAGGFYVPQLQISEPDTQYSHYLNMSKISDGTLRMLGMLTAFYQAKPPLRIALEEPEQMIHPGLLAVLVDAARDYLDSRGPKKQIFLTTHSPTLLDFFEPESIVGARFDNGVSKFSKMTSRQMDIVRQRLFTPGELLVAEGLGV